MVAAYKTTYGKVYLLIFCYKYFPVGCHFLLYMHKTYQFCPYLEKNKKNIYPLSCLHAKSGTAGDAYVLLWERSRPLSFLQSSEQKRWLLFWACTSTQALQSAS